MLHRREVRPRELRGPVGLQDSDSQYRPQLGIRRIWKSLWPVLMLTRNAVYPTELQVADDTAAE